MQRKLLNSRWPMSRERGGIYEFPDHDLSEGSLSNQIPRSRNKTYVNPSKYTYILSKILRSEQIRLLKGILGLIHDIQPLDLKNGCLCWAKIHLVH